MSKKKLVKVFHNGEVLERDEFSVSILEAQGQLVRIKSNAHEKELLMKSQDLKRSKGILNAAIDANGGKEYQPNPTIALLEIIQELVFLNIEKGNLESTNKFTDFLEKCKRVRKEFPSSKEIEKE